MSEVTTFLPIYEGNAEYSAELLRSIVPLMMKHKVAPHPINYAIWYEYVSGSNAELKAEVDKLVRENREFDEKVSLDLYKKYICNASVEFYEKINFDLKKLIDNAINYVHETSNQVSGAGDNFEIHSQQLKKVNDAENLKKLLADIVTETEQLTEISNKLKTQLNDANSEMELLKGELNQVRQLATTDALTGLLNRRAFDEMLAELIENNINASHCLMILDLDHFKLLNDSFGHLVGDKVIRFTAGMIKKYVADHHYAARYGGEEMAVIMPDTDIKQAYKIGDTIRDALAKSQLKQRDNGRSIGKVTVSVGVTALELDDNIESFISRADKALYAAKEAGRNRVVKK